MLSIYIVFSMIMTLGVKVAVRFPKYGSAKAQTLRSNVIFIIIKMLLEYMAKMLQSYEPLITVRVPIGDLIIFSSSLEWI